jgi:[acyl-carrier-protein] S-malonyltransferase
MGKALSDAFPICRETFAEADDALGDRLSWLCFEGPEDELLLTENAQPAILTVSVAAHRLLASHGFAPALVAGHSLGEYSANVAADRSPTRTLHAGSGAAWNGSDVGHPWFGR